MRLVVLEGPAAHPTFELHKERTLIGRGPDCDVVVFDAQVSRHHAQILRLGDAYVFENLQPANPSIVNDRIVTTRRRLADGDLLVMGSLVMQVDIPPAPQTTAHTYQSVSPPAGSPPVVGPAHGSSPQVGAPSSSPVSATPPQAASQTVQLGPPPQPTAPRPQPAVPPIEERRTPRPPTLPPPPPREQIKAMAARLGEAGRRLQTRMPASSDAAEASAADSPVVERIVADHERLGGDEELARLASLLSDRLSNQTDIRALYRLGAEAAILIAWSRIAQRSMNEAVHLADALGIH